MKEMRGLLQGWIPPTEDRLKEYWEVGLFAVDANVLLGLYKRPKDPRGQFLEALRRLGDRLWVPHQAATEYLRNRLRVLIQQRTAKAQLGGALEQVSTKAKGDLGHLLQQMGRRDFESLDETVEKAFQKLQKEILKAEEENRDSLGDSIRIDPLLDEILDLCEGKVGEPIEGERLSQVHEQAQSRIDDQRPPGYEDADKPIPERYGDYVLWEQLCVKAKEIDQPLILITDDLKEDWVWREHGQMIGPRPELIEELSERGGIPFHLYSSTQFLALSSGEETEIVADSETEPSDRNKASIEDLSPMDLPNSAPPNVHHYQPKIDLENPRSNPPVPLHRFTGEGVLLGLNRHPGGMFSKVRCAVVDPTGSATAHTIPFSGLGSVAFMGSPAVKAIYPRDFPGATILPGLHQVIWYRIDEMGYLQVGGNGEREIARDSFVISVDQTDK